MFWADQLVQNLDKNVHHRVDDMKTPSGHAHAGSLRTISTHGLIYEAMKRAGFSVDFTYVINDMDPMDSLPNDLDQKEYQSHMGKPLFIIPAPDKLADNYAVQFANEYIKAFNKIGFTPQIIWSSTLYKNGQMDELIQIALDHVDEIRKIYKEVADQDKPKDWYPFQVICPRCGKIGPNLVTDWDGKNVTYECKTDLVKWAKGCGEKGRISPFGGTGKLMWKVDWPAHWVALKITVEGAGKDHFSAGGSRYIGAEIIKRVFKKNPPFGFLHEFLLIGGSKMSSSKGIGMSAYELTSILPPEIGKFLFVRTPYQRALNFDPFIPQTIPDLFDEYDRAAKTWYAKKNGDDLARMFEASQINKLPKTNLFLPRFRQVASLIQMPSVNITDYFSKEKGSSLNQNELEILEERIKYAKIWLGQFAGENDRFTIQKQVPKALKNLDSTQVDFLINLAKLLENNHYTDGNSLQQAIYNFAKEEGVEVKKAFQAIYIALLGKDHGPKAGWLILSEIKRNRDFITNRFKNQI